MSTQCSFSIRVSSSVKTVHVVGSWDSYAAQLPLARDKASTSGKSWCGTFRFGKSVQPGERYWYYFVVDGYHCAVNPSVDSIVEPTTGRELNILDVPKDKSSKDRDSRDKHSSSKHSSSSSSRDASKHSSSSSKHSSSKESSKHSSSKHSSSKESSSHSKHSSSHDKDRKSRHLSVDIPKGRPLSVSAIKSPKPITPLAATHILRYDEDEIDALAAKFGGTVMIDDEGGVSAIHVGSPSSSSADGSSYYYRSDSSSPSSHSSRSSGAEGSSASGYSTPSSEYAVCTCDNYGITRRGDRIKIDCGGRVCGYSDDDMSSSGCSSGDEAASPVRRRGVVFR